MSARPCDSCADWGSCFGADDLVIVFDDDGRPRVVCRTCAEWMTGRPTGEPYE